MHSATKIVSFKSYTPPASGDLFLHPRLGQVKLGHRSAGAKFWATPTSDPLSSSRFEVLLSQLQRCYEDD